MSAMPPPMPAGPGVPPPAAPRPKSMSGCAIVAIVGSAVLVVGVFIVAILAAIALPAYQDYTTRTRLMQLYLTAVHLQPDVDAYREDTGECPDNAALGLAPDESYDLLGGGDTPGRARVQVAPLEPGRCAIELVFQQPGAAFDGQSLLLESTPSGWTCHGGSLAQPLRPTNCRTPAPHAATESAP